MKARLADHGCDWLLWHMHDDREHPHDHTHEESSPLSDIAPRVNALESVPVESVQRGRRSRGYDHGRFIVDAGRTDMNTLGIISTR